MNEKVRVTECSCVLLQQRLFMVVEAELQQLPEGRLEGVCMCRSEPAQRVSGRLKVEY